MSQITAQVGYELRRLARRYAAAAVSGTTSKSSAIRRRTARWAEIARAFQQYAIQAEVENRRAAGARWRVTPESGWVPAVQLAGPGVDDLVQMIVATLAEADHVDDVLHVRWNTYIAARRHRLTAEAEGIDELSMARLEDAEASAWDALSAELPSSVRARLPEAEHISLLLDDAVHMVGQVAA